MVRYDHRASDFNEKYEDYRRFDLWTRNFGYYDSSMDLGGNYKQ